VNLLDWVFAGIVVACIALVIAAIIRNELS
jgi:hypothetical protein